MSHVILQQLPPHIQTYNLGNKQPGQIPRSRSWRTDSSFAARAFLNIHKGRTKQENRYNINILETKEKQTSSQCSFKFLKLMPHIPDVGFLRVLWISLLRVTIGLVVATLLIVRFVLLRCGVILVLLGLFDLWTGFPAKADSLLPRSPNLPELITRKFGHILQNK